MVHYSIRLLRIGAVRAGVLCNNGQSGEVLPPKRMFSLRFHKNIQINHRAVLLLGQVTALPV